MAKVQINPKQLYERRNTTDVFSRLIILGVLRVLNRHLKYEQVWADSSDGIQEVNVPFFFNFSNANTTEKFIQDNYSYWTAEECTSIGLKPIAGDYKPIPYGVINLDSTSIESGSISNRFVMGQYQKKIGKEMKSYVSFLYSIPLSMSFSVNITCDTVNSMWKIEQAFREYFYKNKTFHVNYKGTIVPARIGFPESLPEQKTDTYSFGNANADGADIKLNFSLQVETYQPVFDPFTEMPADAYANFSAGILMQEKKNIKPVMYKGDQIGKITAVSIFNDNTTLCVGQDVLLEWNFNYEHTDALIVDIMYEDEDGNEKVIDIVDNHNCYHLEVSEDIVDSTTPLFDIIIPNDDGVMIINNPVVKIYPDENGIVIDKNAKVLEKGFILTDKQKISAILSYEDNGKIVDKEIQFNIVNNMLDEDNPTTFQQFVYKGKVNYKKIKLFVRDHHHPEIKAYFSENYIKVF